MFKRLLGVVTLGSAVVGCASGSDDTAAAPSPSSEAVAAASESSILATSDSAEPPSNVTVSTTSDSSILATSDSGDAGPTTTATDAGLLPTADAELLGSVYALMLTQITREEAAAFLGISIPETEVAACMSEAGFDYVPGASPEEQVAGDVRYTMSAEEYAATYGFGLTGWDLGIIPAVEPDNDRPSDGASGAQSDAYHQAVAQCRGSLPGSDRWAWSNAINVAVGQFRGVVEVDERMVAGLAEWQSCMGDAGYRFETPMSMRESFSARMNNTDEDLQQIFDDEVRVAVANVPCEAAYIGVQREVISSRFDEFQAMFDAALASGASPDAQG